jgi:hypothetical protein
MASHIDRETAVARVVQGLEYDQPVILFNASMATMVHLMIVNYSAEIVNFPDNFSL